VIASSIRSTEINPGKLGFLFKKQFEMCKVRPGETIALVGDLATRPEYIEASFAAAEELGADVYELRVNSIPSWTKVGVPTIGKCKGTLEAIKAADLLVIFHVPLFTKWLKEVMDAGTRVLMIIDAPDDLEQLMSPPGLKDALKHAEARYRKTREVRVISEAGTDLTYSCGEYPVMTQWGYADEPGHFDHWGGGHIHTFPNEGSARGTVGVETRPKRGAYSTICLVVAGSGCSAIGDSTFEWSQNDVFTIPPWSWASHKAIGGKADLFVVSDKVVFERLDVLREEIQ
jgi:2,5-dihydroxypyridine 5,6-dioxygenase